MSLYKGVHDIIHHKFISPTWTGGQSVTKLVSKRKTNETSASRTKDKIKQYDRKFLLMRKEQCSRKPDSLPSISELISSVEKVGKAFI